MNYFLCRLKEPSTWRGMVAILTAFGVTISPEQVEAIVAVGLSVMGLIGLLTPDKTKK